MRSHELAQDQEVTCVYIRLGITHMTHVRLGNTQTSVCKELHT